MMSTQQLLKQDSSAEPNTTDNLVFRELRDEMDVHRPPKRELLLQEECGDTIQSGMISKPHAVMTNLECHCDMDESRFTKQIDLLGKHRRRRSSSSSSSSSCSSSSSSDLPSFIPRPTIFTHMMHGDRHHKQPSLSWVYINEAGSQYNWNPPKLLHNNLPVILKPDPSIILDLFFGDGIHAFAFKNDNGVLFYIKAPSEAGHRLVLTDTKDEFQDFYTDPRCFEYVGDPKSESYLLKPVVNKNICVGIGEVSKERFVKTVNIDAFSPNWQLDEVHDLS